jgi:hypothetical protein
LAFGPIVRGFTPIHPFSSISEKLITTDDWEKIMKTLNQFIPLIAAVGLLLFGSGCASNPTVKPGFDFSRYHTFAILPVTARGTYEDPSIVSRLSRPVQETVVNTLSAKGFKQVQDSEADFLVKLLFDYQPDQGRYENRMFDLQVIDRQSKEIVWSDFWHRKTDTTLPEAVVRKGVAGMLKPFPPGNPPAGH